MFTSTILQQVCDECHRTEAKDTWRAVVQLRQKVNHKRTFYYLEQLILKHGMHRGAINLREVSDGIDFFFANKNTAIKLNEFLQGNVPVRYVPGRAARAASQHLTRQAPRPS